MNLGAFIKNYREQHSLSMQEFSEKSGLSKGYISMLESGRHPQTNKPIIPSIETIKKLSCAMGISIDELISILDSNQEIALSLFGHSDGTSNKEPDYVLNDGTLVELQSDQAISEDYAARIRRLLAYLTELNDDQLSLIEQMVEQMRSK